MLSRDIIHERREHENIENKGNNQPTTVVFGAVTSPLAFASR